MLLSVAASAITAHLGGVIPGPTTPATVVGLTQYNSDANATTHTFPVPEAVDGDLLVFILGYGDVSAPAAPAGWTEQLQANYNRAQMAVFSKRAGEDESTFVDITLGGSARAVGAIYRIEAGGEIEVAEDGFSGNTSTHTAPSIDAETDDLVLFTVVGGWGGGFTYTPPSGATLDFMQTNSAAGVYGTTTAGIHETATTDGPTGSRSFSCSAGLHYAAATIKIGPGVAPGPGPDPEPVYPWAVAVTVPSGKVASDLTGFPVMVDLSHLPDGFWSLVAADGGNVRVRAGEATIPHDLTYINPELKIGRLYAKTDLAAAADTSFEVCLDNDTDEKLAVDDTNGRNAVWSDYLASFVFPETVNRTGYAAAITVDDAGIQRMFREVGSGGLSGNPHQGMATDGTYLYTIDTNIIRKVPLDDYTAAALVENTDPCGEVNTALSASVSHCTDGTVIDGELWMVVNTYPGTNNYLCVFNLDDLTFNRGWDIQADTVGRHLSAVAYDPDEDLIYASDYYDASQLLIFNRSAEYQGTVDLTSTFTDIQGLEIFGPYFILNCHGQASSLQAFKRDGTYVGRAGHISSPEGLCTTPDDAVAYGGQLFAMNEGGGMYRLEYLTGLEDFWYLSAGQIETTLPRSQVWTISANIVVPAVPSGNDTYFGMASGTSDSNRAGLTYHGATDVIGTWNGSWLDTGFNPPPDTLHRYSLVHVGTDYRSIYVDGTEAAYDAGTNSRPGGTGDMDFTIGAEHHNGSENGVGFYQSVFVRAEGMSADWLAAEHLNHLSPISFYLVDGESLIPDTPGHRYWRLFMEDNNGDTSYTVVGEIEFSEAAGTPMDGSDATGSGISSASTSSSNETSFEHAFDDSYDAASTGNTGTYWSSTSGSVTDQWLSYDFGEDKEIVEVRVLCDRDENRAPRNMRVEYSDTGFDWTTAWVIPEQTGWSIGEWRTFTRP